MDSSLNFCALGEKHMETKVPVVNFGFQQLQKSQEFFVSKQADKISKKQCSYKNIPNLEIWWKTMDLRFLKGPSSTWAVPKIHKWDRHAHNHIHTQKNIIAL